MGPKRRPCGEDTPARQRRPGEQERSARKHGVFFFSTRRRHTRLTCDWSSDVCSSDLLLDARFDVIEREAGLVLCGERALMQGARTLLGRPTSCVGRDWELGALAGILTECKIGRASCRERV